MLRILRLRRFRNALVFRGFAVWVGLRLAAAFLGLPNPNGAQKFLILTAVAVAVFFDARRREEDILLGNLGVPAPAIGATALLLPLLFELFVL